MKKLGHVLPQALGRESILRTARAQAVMRDWVAVVGEAMAARSAPERFDQGTVWVAVEGSAWAQELRMSKDRIVRKLGVMVGDPNLFKDVRFGVRPLPKGAPKGPADEEKKAFRESLEGMTIREIAEQRLSRWRDEEGS